MKTPPPNPGAPPWAPRVWAVVLGFPVAGIIAATATGYPWALGSTTGSLLCIAYTFIGRWRFARWQRRARAWCEFHGLSVSSRSGRAGRD